MASQTLAGVKWLWHPKIRVFLAPYIQGAVVIFPSVRSLDQPSNSLPQVLAGKVRALAVTAPSRLPAAPDIPTTDEAGLPGFYTSVWQALWVPRGTPDAVIETLNKAVRAALADPRVRQRFADLGQEIPPSDQQTAGWLAEFQKAEVEKWVPLVKAAKVKPD